MFIEFPGAIGIFWKKDERKLLETHFYEATEKHPDGNQY